MQIELRSHLRPFGFGLICLLLAGLYFRLVLRSYQASQLALVPELSNLEQAIRLEPSNAEYRELLGRNLTLSGGNLDDAISNYRTAVNLNPYVGRYWLDLAGAYQISGHPVEQEQSVEQAVAADPTAPHVAWEAANFFLVQGDHERAFSNFRVVLANDPEAVDSALSLCWRATQDADWMLDRALPQRPDLYFSFLRLLISQQQVSAAEDVWNHLIKLNQAFPTKSAFPYIRFLLAKQSVVAAQTAWQQLAVVDPSLQSYLPSTENLIVNGDFEENVLNGGFDWWYESTPQASLAVDTNKFFSGTRSLLVTFDGPNPADAGIFQFVAVKPNAMYEFSARSRTENIESASGPRLAIVDAYTNASYVLTDDLLGSTPWRLQRARFQTGPDTNLLLLKIVRQPSSPLIRGQLWVDDFRLVEKSDR